MKLGKATFSHNSAQQGAVGVKVHGPDVLLICGTDGRCAILSPAEARDIAVALTLGANSLDPVALH